MSEEQIANQPVPGSVPEPVTAAPEAASSDQNQSTQVQQDQQTTTDGTAPTQQQPEPQQATQKTVQGSEPEVEADKATRELQNTRRRAQEAERRAERLQAELDAARKVTPEQNTQLSGAQHQTQTPATQQSAPGSADKAPDLSDFGDINEFISAKVGWELKQAEVQKKTKEDQDNQRNRQAEIDKSYNRKVAKTTEKYPDFHEVLQDANFELPIPVLDSIKESEYGPEVAYYLAKNSSEAERIAKLSVTAAIREIGKLEVKLNTVAPTQTKTKHVTQAPEPIKPTVSTQSVPAKKDYGEMPMEEFYKMRQMETFAKNSRGALVPKR